MVSQVNNADTSILFSKSKAVIKLCPIVNVMAVLIFCKMSRLLGNCWKQCCWHHTLSPSDIKSLRLEKSQLKQNTHVRFIILFSRKLQFEAFSGIKSLRLGESQFKHILHCTHTHTLYPFGFVKAVICSFYKAKRMKCVCAFCLLLYKFGYDVNHKIDYDGH